MDESRRKLFTSDLVKSITRLVVEAKDSYQKAKKELDYFDSYENCYPLISEYSYFIDDEVENLNIETKGKSSLEITQEVYNRKNVKS